MHKGGVLQKVRTVAFCAFGVLSLSSMAGMSIGAALFFLASLVTFIFDWKRGEKERLLAYVRSPYGWATLLFFIASLLSLFVAQINPPPGGDMHGFWELKKFHHFLYPVFVAMALDAAVKNPLTSEKTICAHPFWRWWFGMGLLSAFIGIIQFWGASLFPSVLLESRFFRQAGTTGAFHAQGLMFFHLSYASCMCFVTAAACSRFLWPCEKDRRIMWFLLSCLGCLAVFYSYSRIAWVALLLMMITLGLLKKPKWGAGIILAALSFSFIIWSSSSSMRTRWYDSLAGINERREVWRSSLEMIKDRPWMGVGFGRTGAYSTYYAEKALGRKPEFSSHAHNNFLDITASTGVIGLLTFLAWWGVLFFFAIRAFVAGKFRWIAAAAMVGFWAFHVNGLTQVNFGDGKSQHTLMLWAGIALFLWRHGGLPKNHSKSTLR